MKCAISYESGLLFPLLFSYTVATVNSLAHAVGSMYARKFFKKDAKEAADTMVLFIRKEFDRILNTLDWMDPLTRKRALAKAKAITPHIAYPPELLLDEKLTELYDGVSKNFSEKTRLEHGTHDIHSWLGV